MIRSSGRVLAFWMSAWRFSALFRPNRSRPSRSSTDSRKKSPALRDEPASGAAARAPSSRRPRCPSRRDEVAELLADAGRARGVGAVVADGALVADDRGPADRAAAGMSHSRSSPVRFSGERPDDLRDHVAGLLEDHVVADPDVLAPDLVEVVERGPGDRRAGDLRRREVGDGRQRPRPPDVGDDVLDDRLDLLRRELVGDRPARRPAHESRAGPAARTSRPSRRSRRSRTAGRDAAPARPR